MQDNPGSGRRPIGPLGSCSPYRWSGHTAARGRVGADSPVPLGTQAREWATAPRASAPSWTRFSKNCDRTRFVNRQATLVLAAASVPSPDLRCARGFFHGCKSRRGRRVVAYRAPTSTPTATPRAIATIATRDGWKRRGTDPGAQLQLLTDAVAVERALAPSASEAAPMSVESRSFLAHGVKPS